jgi:hypothetical protein
MCFYVFISDSVLETNKPHAAAVVGKSDVSHGSNFETIKEAENSKSTEI